MFKHSQSYLLSIKFSFNRGAPLRLTVNTVNVSVFASFVSEEQGGTRAASKKGFSLKVNNFSIPSSVQPGGHQGEAWQAKLQYKGAG